MLSLRDLTACGDTGISQHVGTHAITGPGDNCQKEPGRGCGSTKARHTNHMGPESTPSFVYSPMCSVLACARHGLGAIDAALSKFQSQGGGRWSQMNEETYDKTRGRVTL